MPLVRTAAIVPTADAAAPAKAQDSAHQLSAQNAMLQRQISAGRSAPAAGAPQLVNTPVPLQVTGQALPASHPRPVAAAAAAKPVQVSADTASSAPTAPAAPTDLAVGSPTEISQKMMTALDKYMRMQQQQRASAAAAAANGAQIDVSP